MIFFHTVKYTKAAARLLDEDEATALEFWLSDHPEHGAIIPGSGGCRKTRWSLQGRGKRGGARVIYFYRNHAGVILLLRIYAKNETENLSRAEIKQLKNEVKNHE